MTAVAVRNLRFAWPGAPACLDLPSLFVRQGDSLFIHGASGTGKSTLLSLLAGVLQPQQGELSLLGRDMRALGAAGRDRFRADHIGYIFQQFNLLPWLPVLRNVMLPCRLSRRRAQRAEDAGGMRESAEALLASLDIAPALWGRPASDLSVGQQQRVAAARALIGQPELVIADEPTSALDVARRDAFMNLLLAACGRAGSTLVFVSHDERLAGHFGYQLDLAASNRALWEMAP